MVISYLAHLIGCDDGLVEDDCGPGGGSEAMSDMAIWSEGDSRSLAFMHTRIYGLQIVMPGVRKIGNVIKICGHIEI